MATTTEVTVTVYEGRIRALGRSAEVLDFVRGRAELLAEEMRRDAPVLSGAGRDSIRARTEMGADGWVGVASWDTRHYYMGIQNARRHWADRAAAAVRYV